MTPKKKLIEVYFQKRLDVHSLQNMPSAVLWKRITSAPTFHVIAACFVGTARRQRWQPSCAMARAFG